MNFDEGVLYGKAEIQLESLMDNISAIPLDLLKLNIDEILVNGTAISSWQYNDTLLRIPLSVPMNSGDIADVSITYHGEPTLEPYEWGGFHFLSNMAYNLGVAFDAIPHCFGRGWYPCIDDFVDRALYDFYITTEDDKMAVCNGMLESEVNNGNGTITWHWNMAQSLPSYLVAVAVANYVNVEMDYEGVNGPLPINIYVPPGYEANTNITYEKLPELMALYEELWGAYPFDRVGFTATGKGAMEHATNISMPLSTFSPNLSNEILYAHELSHMWFGDMVTCSTAEDMWLNEGWATFNEFIFQEFLFSPEQAHEYYRDMHADVVYKCHKSDGGWYAVSNIPQNVTYGKTAYDKGGCVAHTLRHYLGDEIFFPAIANYLQDFAYQPASSTDMMNSLSSFTGQDMSGFFNGWVFSPGFPGFEIDSVVSVANGAAFDVTVFVQQKLDHNISLVDDNRLPITFVADGVSQMETKIVEFSGEFGQATFTLDFVPAFAMVDYEDHLSDAQTNFTKLVEETGMVNFSDTWCKIDFTSVAPNSWVRVEHNFIPPDPLWETIPGLELSDYRYWRIVGNIPEGTTMEGSFMYNKNTLDENLLANAADSIVLLYRPNPSFNWSGIPFTKVGPAHIGELFPETTLPGEYCLAVWKEEYLNVGEINSIDKKSMRVFPNPADTQVNILFESATNGEVRVFDMQGKCVDVIKTSSDKSEYLWNVKQKENGTYFVIAFDEKNQKVAENCVLVK